MRLREFSENAISLEEIAIATAIMEIKLRQCKSKCYPHVAIYFNIALDIKQETNDSNYFTKKTRSIFKWRLP